MKVLVCGGREFTDKAKLFGVLAEFAPDGDDELVIISGCARGADSLAIDFANYVGCKVEKYPALWDEHGRAAGPIRNQLMLDDSKPDIVVAFPGGRGTEHMVKISKKAGVPVKEVA